MCFPAADGHNYCIEAAIHTTGACLEWISRAFDMQLNDGVDWSKVERVPAGADGLVFLPYIGPGERSPIWDDSARGAFIGITSMHSPEHMVRAVMEGVAFALRQNLDAVEELSGPCGIVDSVGGPSANRVWQQIKADVLGCPVATPVAREATGCAAAAMAAAGIWRWDAVDAIRSANTGRKAVCRPIAANAGVYDELYEVFIRSYQRLKEEFAAIARLLRSHGA
jgi:sugar (pentulose or hexulose) kinase